jgi:NADH-quinone oxidoreductase subunit N
VVPFHLWTPDVYEGAPLPVTAFVATVSKAGVFAFLLRWYQDSSATSQPILPVLVLVSVTSMVFGNLLALRQTNVKRLLAYSSIAHMGYFLVALISGGPLGNVAATYYLAAYLVTILGAFGCLIALGSGAEETRESTRFEELRGLFWSRPLLAALFAVMILSLAGIPLTAGFLGKFYVLTASASAETWGLLFVLIASSTIGLFYYLRIIVAMFATSEATAEETIRTPLGITPRIVLAALTAGLLALGVYPGPLWQAIEKATASLG